MAATPQKKRRLARSLLWLAATGILLLGLQPVWLPWLLAPVARHYGLSFADYDRMGWSRFTLIDVRGNWGRTRLEAQRIESVLPTTWLWCRVANRTNGPPLLSVSGGRLLVAGPTTNDLTTARTGAQDSTGAVLDQISEIGQTLRQWLPAADLTNCYVAIASNLVTIPQAHWQAGRLHGVVTAPWWRGDIEITADVGIGSVLEFAAISGDHEAALRGGFTRGPAGWSWNGELNWRTNRASLTAQFTTSGWWPENAQADFPRWQIPLEILHLDGYENLIASLTTRIVSNRFDVVVTALAQPDAAAAQKGFPELNLSFGATGDHRHVTLNTLRLQSPGLSAILTTRVGITWQGELLAEPGQLRVSVDLGKLPGVQISGQAEGSARIDMQTGRPPSVQFNFSTGLVKTDELEARSMLVSGEFTSPRLKLNTVRADFADGSTLSAAGSFDVATRHILEGRWEVSGGFVGKLLPGFHYASLAASGELLGPLTNLTHRGQVAITNGRTAGLKPFDLQVRWSGEHQHIANANLKVTAGDSVLSLGSTADWDVGRREVAATVHELTLRRGQEELYTLERDCDVNFGAGATNTPGQLWALRVANLGWRGVHHSLSATADLAWPAQGKASLNATNVALADFSDFFEADIAKVLIAELAATAHWSNGPVQSVISAAASLTNLAGPPLDVRGTLKTDEALAIEQLALGTAGIPTLSVTGVVPVRIFLMPGKNVFVRDGSQEIRLAGTWADDRSESYSIPLGPRGKLEVRQPRAAFQISGTPDAPSAELTASATRLSWQSGTNDFKLPRLEDFHFATEIRPDAIRLNAFTAKLDDQPITGTGEWPLPQQAWRELWSDGKLPDWDQAQGSLRLAAAQVAAFSAYLPEALAPEGRFDASLELKPGKSLGGVLALTNAATRPMGTITPVRDIAARARVEANRAVLEDFRGQIGGQPIRADGFVTIPELGGRNLDYQINLHGTNVPLARSPELLLRGDFSVALRGGSNTPPKLSGVVTLHDGLFVQHTSSLVWSAPRRPEWRPPYFSVTNAPFADWTLDLAVRGDRFLRVRTPLVSGTVSADFQLRGSLLTPVLTGDARVNSGRLIFPFGALNINQGFANFSGSDLRGPDLQISASGRNYRYDLRLDVKGPADGANISFSSTPPLTSEQILLMLTAGEMPQSNFAFSDRDRAGRFATFLGKDLLSRYLGTDPAEERLIIRTGESISEAGRLTYSVEYRLTDRWSIIGEYDEFNAFNTDLKWKVFTR